LVFDSLVGSVGLRIFVAEHAGTRNVGHPQRAANSKTQKNSVFLRHGIARDFARRGGHRHQHQPTSNDKPE